MPKSFLFALADLVTRECWGKETRDGPTTGLVNGVEIMSDDIGGTVSYTGVVTSREEVTDEAYINEEVGDSEIFGNEILDRPVDGVTGVKVTANDDEGEDPSVCIG